ncbi:phosphotransferase family protein [Aliidiomarina taiwanensis]|uniref:Phosphotransferase family protein n=1 Tax=Aliidiomarina taiwanensis TaxID=946228 RepID=A0A432X992_9GAMM|nr:phosphotransferase family protein [Aliidiomarina taiwanensis]RUO43983.1 phosphotransferase family protein [Aliidiomarina taiwanensis]
MTAGKAQGIDLGEPVREAESFDEAAVDTWLKARHPELIGSPEVTQFTGGASNWTYRLAYSNGDYILRRPPLGTKAKSAHNMEREFRIQQALKPQFSPIPPMVDYCSDTSFIGTDFYVMERIAGIIPRKNFPRPVTLAENQVHRLCENMLDTLIQLHQVDIEAANLAHLGKGSGFVARQVTGWNQRYQQSRTWNVPRATRLMHWLEDHMPSQESLCMTHNDFRFDNLILDPKDPTNILAVLDWELATIGDPLMEVGNMLAYWVQADDDRIARATRRQPTHLKGMLTRQQVIDYYCDKTGQDHVDMTFYEVFGLFRLSVIAQQIYYRYYHKQTRNPAFKNFWFVVRYLQWRANRRIKQGAR